MDWGEIEAGPALDRAVAEQIGWHVRRIVPGRQVRYQLIRPDGELEGTFNAEQDAWLEVPSYSTNLKAALGLVEGSDGEFLLRRAADGGWWAEIGTTTLDAATRSAAEAIARAWLASRAAGDSGGG